MTAGRELLRLQRGGNSAAGRRRRTIICLFPKLPGSRTRRRWSESDGWRWRQDRAEEVLQRHFGVGIAGRIRLRRQATRDPRGRGSARITCLTRS